MEDLLSLLLSTFRVSTPLVFAAMGGCLSERSGVSNIALEGFMLVGAFSAAAATALTHSPMMGAGAAIVVTAAFAAIFALSVIQLKADQIVAGTAMNLLAFGLVPLASKALFDSTGATPALELADRFTQAPMWGALATAVGVHLLFRYQRVGMWVQFAGESPEALATAGVRVRGVRWFAVLASGALAGLGGASLSIFLSSSYSRGMTAGRGFMALAALIFGKWKPLPAFAACLFFGLTDALQIRLQGAPIWGGEPIPVQFIQVLPYAVTVFVLAGFMGKSRPPKAIAQPWAWATVLLPVGLVLAAGMGISACTRRESKPLPAASSAAAAPGGQASAEILQEILRSTLATDQPSEALYAGLLSAIQQGASIEGIHNGITHSSAYRALERNGMKASKEALGFFLEQFQEARSRQASPLPLSAAMALPLAEIEMPTGAPSAARAEKAPGAARKAAGQEEDERIRALFKDANPYTMKRLLADAWIDALAEMRKVPPGGKGNEFFVRGYVQLVTLWNNRYAHIPLGLDRRLTPDGEFHRRWLAGLTESLGEAAAFDRAEWEVLNRMHRIFNFYQAGGSAPVATAAAKKESV